MTSAIRHVNTTRRTRAGVSQRDETALVPSKFEHPELHGGQGHDRDEKYHR